MKDKRHIYITLFFLTLLLFFSCSQEEEPLRVGTDGNSEIVFWAGLPGVETRSENTHVGSLNDGFHVTAFCPEDETKVDGSGKLSEYFSEQFVTKTPGMGDGFRSELCRWPENKGTKAGTLKFFAFYPSREVLGECAGVEDGSGYFNLTNSSTKKGTTVTYSYLMKKFKINKDISRHVDFVIATAEGSKTGNLYSYVNLDFQHQLSGIEFKAWGNPTTYEIEIAGVRLGYVNTESDFDFTLAPSYNLATADRTRIGRWLTSSPSPVKGNVEYIYREGDVVFPIGTGQYNTSGKASSIMGNGGIAMVIPGSNQAKWSKSKTVNGLYFSVLLRVKDKYGMLLYPYIEGADMNASTTTAKMNVVYLAVNKATGAVKKRLYKKGDNYYTDEGFTIAYSLNESDEEVRNYGWAAIQPSGTATWKAGYTYTYTFSYSTGVGVQDPADAFPGKPIISEIGPAVSVADFLTGHEKDVTDLITIEP